MTVESAQQYHTNQHHYLRADVVFGTTGVIDLGWVPAGAVIIGGGVAVATAFNSATSDTLDIGFADAGDGTSDDDDSYATALDISSVGVKDADELATSAGVYLSEGAKITATYAQSGTAATAGAGYVFIEYLVDNEGV